MKDFKFEDRKTQVESLNRDEAIKIVYMWCKQNQITFKQFIQLELIINKK